MIKLTPELVNNLLGNIPMAIFELGPQRVIDNLVNSVKVGDCILFLGSAVHAPPPADSPYVYPEEARPPLGRELTMRLAEECDFAGQMHEENLDLQRVSLCYEMKGLGRKALVDSLVDHLGKGKRPSPALHMLAALPFKIIVTTNYDQLLEQALHDCGKREVLFVYDPTQEAHSQDMFDEPTPERPLLFKIHGDLDRRESIVITDEDYIGFVQRMSEKDQCHPVPGMVRHMMKRWPTLFVGYGLHDYNLRLLFRSLRWGIDISKIPMSFSVDVRPDPLIVEVWEKQRRFITFVTRNLWEFVPWLHEKVLNRELSAGATGNAT